MAGEKTEAPTPKKRTDARKQGQVARSVELGSVGAIFVSFAMIQMTGPNILEQLRTLMVTTFQPATMAHVSEGSLVTLTSNAMSTYFNLIMPICLALAAAGLAINFGQTKGLFSTQALKPNLGKLNPLSGLKRMFSMQALVELGKSIVKIGACAFIGYQIVAEKYPRFLEMQNGSLISSAGFFCGVALELGFKVGALLLAMAALDYFYQRQQFEKKLKMSHQEIKEESRSAEGDPQLKAHIRQTQRQTARRRMMQAVPTADVVLTNPTHLAVALKYDPKKKTAPVVVAKGADLIAEQIKKVARENRVQVMENKPLAQALFKMVEIGDEIPNSLFQAVAEVLAFIYHLKQSGRQQVS